ncbi:MAG: arginine deiminase family protein, partial [Fulvivirga sp.]|nr:arginine deiminase family protein [Fulvivirga sp.]
MALNNFSQYNETGKLRKVVIGRCAGYAEDPAYIELVNEDQKKGLPDKILLNREFNLLVKTLMDKGVEVKIPEYVGPFVYDQLTPRDIGVTIKDRFVLCNMVKKSRRYEAAGIFTYLNEMKGKSPAILIPPDNDMLLEGGDIILDENKIFVGISQRTNDRGLKFMEKHFGEFFEFIPVYCKSIEEGENVLHLDCTFNRIGKDIALIFPDGFKEIPKAMES